MTIDSGWVKILKTMAPGSFSHKLPVTPDVVFIDGQIKLMKGEWIKTWQAFLEHQFVRTVEAAFQTGAHTVVLGFDNYDHVPTAKAPTQRRRSAKIEVLQFGHEQDLPPFIPDCWPQAMRNRAFKNKVVNFVVCNMRRLYATGERTLVIDWRGPVEVLGKRRELPPVVLDPQLKRGECDCKAFNYMHMGSLLIISTDGDYVPMGMLQLELASTSAHPIYIHRMLTRLSKKRSEMDKKREFEFVHLNSLLLSVGRELNLMQHPAEVFAALVAMTGCDFTLGLPRLGPVKIWQARAAVHRSFRLHECDVLLVLVKLYAFNFSKICGPSATLMAIRLRQDEGSDANRSHTTPLVVDEYVRVYQKLQASKLTPAVKTQIWSARRTHAHARNVLWTLLYWTRLHDYPDPVSGEGNAYGYCVNPQGAVGFDAGV